MLSFTPTTHTPPNVHMPPPFPTSHPARRAPASAARIYKPTGATYKVGQPIRVCAAAIVKFPTPIGAPTVTIAQNATMRIEQITGSSLPATIGTGTSGMPTQCPTA